MLKSFRECRFDFKRLAQKDPKSLQHYLIKKKNKGKIPVWAFSQWYSARLNGEVT